MKLRLYHHPDGARIAYRERGTGPGLVLWHSALLSHRELTPLVEHLEHRYRVVLPDLPLHGDSEDRPRHPYTPEWLAGVVAAFCVDVAGPRPLIGGHGLGGELVLRAVADDLVRPAKLIVLPNALHRPPADPAWARWRRAARLGGTPGADRVLMRAARVVVRPGSSAPLTTRPNPAAEELVRGAFEDAVGNANLARSWAKLARAWPPGARRELLDAYPGMDMPVLLLWADEDGRNPPAAAAEEALDLLPDGLLRILPRTGYLMAYDDPVGVAREIAAFVG